MELSYISRTCAPACHPLQPPQKGLQRCPYAATTRGLRQPPNLPCYARDFLPNLSCISRNLSSISRVAFLPVPPFQPPPKGFQRGLCPPPPRPRRRPSPASRLPRCAQDFLPNLSYISRILTYTSRTSAPACTTPSTAAKGPPARPVPSPRRDAGGLRLPPTTPGAAGPDP